MKFVSIQKKIIAAGTLITILISSILYFLLDYSIKNSLVKLEDSDVRKAIIRIDNGLENHFKYLLQKTGDWAKWDATYDFVNNDDEEFYDQYVEENLTAEALETLNVDFMTFLDSKGKIIKHVAYEPNAGEIYEFEYNELQTINSVQKILLKRPDTEFINGYISLDGRDPLLITIHKILKSDGSGPSTGFLIVGNFFDQNLKKVIVDSTLYPVFIQKIDDPKMPSNFVEAKEHLLKGNPDYIYHNADNSYGYILVNDIWGEPSFIARVNVPRELIKKSLVTINYSLFAVFAGGVMLSFMGYFFIRRYALSPIRKLHQSVSTSSEGHLDLSHLNIQGNDEISYLAQEIKHVFEELSKAEGNLTTKNEELERMNRLMIGRELKMAELKEEIIKLKKKYNLF